MAHGAEHSNGFGGALGKEIRFVGSLKGRTLVLERDCLSQLNWPMLQNLLWYCHLLHQCVRK